MLGIKKHLILIVIACLVWAAFYIIGLPSDYFLSWSIAEQMLLTLIGFFAIIPFFCFFLVVFLGGDYFKTSLWVAFYASVEIFVLDFLVVGLIEDKGISYLISHWYLTIGYVEAWIVMPLVGLALKKFKQKDVRGYNLNPFIPTDPWNHERIL